jgi:hypothetical protein
MFKGKPKTVDAVVSVFTDTMDSLKDIVARNNALNQGDQAHVNRLEEVRTERSRENSRALSILEKLSAIVE